MGGRLLYLSLSTVGPLAEAADGRRHRTGEVPRGLDQVLVPGASNRFWISTIVFAGPSNFPHPRTAVIQAPLALIRHPQKGSAANTTSLRGRRWSQRIPWPCARRPLRFDHEQSYSVAQPLLPVCDAAVHLLRP